MFAPFLLLTLLQFFPHDYAQQITYAISLLSCQNGCSSGCSGSQKVYTLPNSDEACTYVSMYEYGTNTLTSFYVTAYFEQTAFLVGLTFYSQPDCTGAITQTEYYGENECYDLDYNDHLYYFEVTAFPSSPSPVSSPTASPITSMTVLSFPNVVQASCSGTSENTDIQLYASCYPVEMYEYNSNQLKTFYFHNNYCVATGSTYSVYSYTYKDSSCSTNVGSALGEPENACLVFYDGSYSYPYYYELSCNTATGGGGGGGSSSSSGSDSSSVPVAVTVSIVIGVVALAILLCIACYCTSLCASIMGGNKSSKTIDAQTTVTENPVVEMATNSEQA